MFVAVLAMTLAAAALDASHAAVAQMLRSRDLGYDCTAAERDAAAAGAAVTPLGSVDGESVILVGVRASCMCGNVNCLWFVLRLDPAGPRFLLSPVAESAVVPVASKGLLPNLQEETPSGGSVSWETIEAYRDGRYVPVASYRENGETGERKRNGVPIRFAPGTSSTLLRGRASSDWYDEYAFTAARGQRLTISNIRSPATVTLKLLGPHWTTLHLEKNVAVVLPERGTYTLQIGTTNESPKTPYSLVLAIH